MATTTAAKNTMLDALTLNTLKLHNGAVGADGTSNQISGASQSVTYDAASGGSRDLDTTYQFTGLAAGVTVSHFSVWNGSTFIYGDAFDASETYANANGIANVSSAAVTVADA